MLCTPISRTVRFSVENMSRAQLLTGRSRGWPEKRDAFDEFHETAVDDQIELQERKAMLDLYGRHR